MIVGIVLFVLGFSIAAGQNPNCDYYQQVLAGRTYTINSPGWPASYQPGITCRWIADCPTGYRCRLRCSEISLPQITGVKPLSTKALLSLAEGVNGNTSYSTASCSGDRLLVSLTGNDQLIGAQTYCGSGTLNVVSTSTRISMGLITDRRSRGGRFTCQVAAEAVSTPTPGCRCGDRRRTRIVGGNETGVNEYPSMVGIADVRISQITCGGVIISQWHVLTAAHCFVGESSSNYAVIVGEHDITAGDSPATQAYRINSFTSHPRFTESNFDYDILIARVANAIVFSDLVGPVCMPFKFRNNNLAGTKVTMLGWGTLFPGGPTSNTLQQVDVDVITQNRCSSVMPGITARQMCTYTPGHDACQYDSGGPLLYTDPASGRLFSVGIISYGRFCASGYPGVNTRVTALLNWIVQNTRGATFCNIQ